MIKNLFGSINVTGQVFFLWLLNNPIFLFYILSSKVKVKSKRLRH
jgi:hypothetical protein